MPQHNPEYIVTNLGSESPYTEAFRIVRTNILASPTPLRMLMVTSARSGQGKSTVSANLAIVTAQLGTRVLLIDADLRRPTLHRYLGTPNKRGLSNVLAGEIDWRDAVYETGVEDLLLLPAGKPPKHPAEMLSGRTMQRLLSEWRQEADLVYIDTPPVAAFSEPLVLAPQMDGVILAYRASQVPRDIDIRAKMLLESHRANILGVILTNVQADECDSYYYHYSYYTQRLDGEAEELEANGASGHAHRNGTNGHRKHEEKIELTTSDQIGVAGDETGELLQEATAATSTTPAASLAPPASDLSDLSDESDPSDQAVATAEAIDDLRETLYRKQDNEQEAEDVNEAPPKPARLRRYLAYGALGLVYMAALSFWIAYLTGFGPFAK